MQEGLCLDRAIRKTEEYSGMDAGQSIETVTEVIRAFGGYNAACTLFGVSRSLLSRWETEGLPGKRLKQIAALAEMKNIPGLTIERLAQVVPSKLAA